MQFKTKTVFVAVVGRPNVGKSSLLNALVGEKIAIVTPKAQTTRTKITGILTKGDTQFVFLDTPGIHKPKNKLGERMVKTVANSVADVDVTLMLFEPYGNFTVAEQELVQSITAQKMPAIAAINKTDTVKDKTDLLPRLTAIQEMNAFESFFPICVHKNEGLDTLLDEIEKYAQPGPHYFSADSFTDLPEKTIVEEIVREKLFTNLRDEIPYGTMAVVESFKERGGADIIDIGVNIYCEKKSHKGMVIGKGGEMLKKIASEARADIEEFLGTKVYLECWVKVKDDWRNSEFMLNDFGFKK